MADFTMTPNPDTFVGTVADETVQGTALTLNAGDSLDGGAGYDVLQLFGSGNFDLSALAQFTGFEQVDLTNIAGGVSNLTLRDGLDLTVNVDNEANGGGTVTLGSGTTTLNLGTSYSYSVFDSSGAATITANGYNNHFYMGSGTSTITDNGQSDSFSLGSGTATLNLGGSYNNVYVSSGQVTINFTTLGSGIYNFVYISNPGSLNPNDVFNGTSGSNNYFYVLGGNGEELNLTTITFTNSWGLSLNVDNITADVKDRKSVV